jgi:hypothetical protein
VKRSTENDGANCSCPFFAEAVFGEENSMQWIASDGSVKCSGMNVRFCPFCGRSVPLKIAQIVRWSARDEQSVRATFVGSDQADLIESLRLKATSFWITPDIITARGLIADCEIDFILDACGKVCAANFMFSGIRDACRTNENVSSSDC